MSTSLVKDWFRGFFKRHVARHRREDWPMSKDEATRIFWQSWRANLIEAGVDEEIADKASERMQRNPPKFLDGHLRELIEIAREIRGDSVGSPAAFEAALAASKGCPDCGGQMPGLAHRWPHNPEHAFYGSPVPFHCACPLGRYLDEQDKLQPPAKRSMIPLLADHPELMLGRCDWSDRPDNKFRYRPEHWDHAAGRPLDADKLPARPSRTISEHARIRASIASFPAKAEADAILDRLRARNAERQQSKATPSETGPDATT